MMPAAQAFLQLLAQNGVLFFFVNSGTDFPDIAEALARRRSAGFPAPRTLLVPHENVAVGMAYGVTMLTGQAQALMVHVNVGTANAVCGLINAARENIPMLMCAGRTPWFERGSAASRTLNIHWAQEMFDQGALVREHVKWDYELRGAEQLHDIIDRALAIAHAAPQGPVYLSLPREVLHQQSPPVPSKGSQARVSAFTPDPVAVEDIARAMAQARRPLIITARAGREPEAVPLLAALSSERAWPVVEFRPRYLSLPNRHPMHGGYEVRPWLEEADAILVLDCDVPWIPAQAEPRADARIFQIGNDPLFARYPTRGFRSDGTVQASPAAFLQALGAALSKLDIDSRDRTDRLAWLQRIQASNRTQLAAAINQGSTAQGPLTMAAVSHVLGQALKRYPSAIVINEYSLVIAAMDLDQPGSYFGSSPVGGLGWGLPAALGAKLARPDALVVAVLGDGSYGFANPLACHHAAAMHGIATLTVILNNAGYGAVDRATRALHPDGAAARQGMELVSLEPAPRYTQVIESCGGWGARVETLAGLMPAIDQAIEQVQGHQRPALVDVICR
jgi:acetolactate synthase-1/2/3 large subunit